MLSRRLSFSLSPLYLFLFLSSLSLRKEKKAAPSGRDLMTPQQKRDADVAAMKIKNDARDAAAAGGGAPAAKGKK